MNDVLKFECLWIKSTGNNYNALNISQWLLKNKRVSSALVNFGKLVDDT